jgi:hypothetical protein
VLEVVMIEEVAVVLVVCVLQLQQRVVVAL